MTEKMMCSGRVVEQGLQTAVQEYRHPAGRSILMVGCVHVAELDYYTELRKVVDDAEAAGATVFMEGTSFKDTSADDASEEELAVMRALREGLRTQYEDLPVLLDLPWVYQERSALAPYPDTWRRSDARALDMVRLLGPHNAVGLAPSAGLFEGFRQLKESKGVDSFSYQVARGAWAKSFFAPFEEQKPRSWLVLLIRRIVGRVALMRTRKTVPAANSWMIPYVMTYRECIGAQCALEAKNDVVMLWHPSHMAGIGGILARNGFEPQEPRQWITACHDVDLTPERKSKKRHRDTGQDKGFTRGDAE